MASYFLLHLVLPTAWLMGMTALSSPLWLVVQFEDVQQFHLRGLLKDCIAVNSYENNIVGCTEKWEMTEWNLHKLHGMLAFMMCDQMKTFHIYLGWHIVVASLLTLSSFFGGAFFRLIVRKDGLALGLGPVAQGDQLLNASQAR